MENNSDFVDDLIDSLSQSFREMIPEFCREWQIIGFDSYTQKEFGQAILQHSQELLADMQSEIKQRKETLYKSINNMTREIETISKKLNIDVDLDIDGLSLLAGEKHLRSQLQDLNEIKEGRLAQLKELFDKESEICLIMGAKPVGLDTTIPTEDELQGYETYVSSQEAEMIRLKDIFKETRLEIIKIMEKLGYTPKNDFEQSVINDHHNFIFNSINMERLHNLREEIMEKLTHAKEIADKKRQELIILYEFLDVDKEFADEFLDTNSGCDAETINNLTKEIKNCQDIKMKNIEKFIKNIREKILKMWNDCLYSDEQREKFKAYKYQTYTEEFLTLHELELDELKHFYNKNIKIFDLFHQEEEMTRKMGELDLRAEDPNRLNNRGGQLLEEEKARKQIGKSLPKIKAKLLELLEEYETNNGVPFTFYGLTYDEYTQKRIERFNEEKENLKLLKAKEKMSGKKTPLSASRRNLAVSLRTAHTTVKRKLPLDKSPGLTGLGGSSKKRLVQSEKTRPILGSKIRRSGKVARRLLSNSLRKESPKKSKTPKISITDMSRDSLLQPYHEFQEHLSSRNECRSTLISEQLLKSVKADKKMKTPVKTPVKPLRKHLVNASTPHITPRQTPRAGSSKRPSRSPRIGTTPRLTTAPSNGLDKLKL